MDDAAPTRHPLARHEAEAAAALTSGDASKIKGLYVRLGSYFAEANLNNVPVLSLPGTAPAVMKLVEELHSGGQGLALDAGCGPNPALAMRLAEAGRPTVAMDIGLGTVVTALRVAADAGLALVGVVGDLERLPFRNGIFSVVTCEDTIEHVPDDQTAAAELARVTRGSGAVVVATPNRNSAGVLRHKLTDRLQGRRRPRSAYFVSVSHLREYTFGELEDLLAPHLAVSRRAGVGWDLARDAPAVRLLLARLATWLFTRPALLRFSRMVVVAGRPRRLGS